MKWIDNVCARMFDICAKLVKLILVKTVGLEDIETSRGCLRKTFSWHIDKFCHKLLDKVGDI